MKRTTALIPLTLLTVTLTGCSLAGGGESKPTTTEKPTLSLEGDFVFAPAAGEDAEGETSTAPQAPTSGDAPDVGDLFTLTVDGSQVTVTRQSCSVDAEGVAQPTTDARETAFGELGDANSETAAPITWLEGGAFAEDEKSDLTVQSDDMVKIGEHTFFAADGTQGSALADQFEDGCSTPDEDESTETPEPTETSPAQPSTAHRGRRSVMEIFTFIIGFAVATLVVPAGISSRVQNFTRRKVAELIRNRKGGDRQ